MHKMLIPRWSQMWLLLASLMPPAILFAQEGAGQSHLFLGATAGVDHAWLGDDDHLKPYFRQSPIAQTVNASLMYQIGVFGVEYRYDLVDGKLANPRPTGNVFPPIVLKVEYYAVRNTNTDFDTSIYANKKALDLYGGVPSEFSRRHWGFHLGMTRHMGKQNRSIFYGTVGYQIGTATLMNQHDGQHSTTVRFNTRGLDIGMGFVFALSDAIGLHWDLFGTTRTNMGESYELEHHTSALPTTEVAMEETLLHYTMYMRLGLGVRFIKY